MFWNTNSLDYTSQSYIYGRQGENTIASILQDTHVKRGHTFQKICHFWSIVDFFVKSERCRAKIPPSGGAAHDI